MIDMNSGFINSTIICNERKDVDLDALNYLASDILGSLCQCSYKNENKHHHFLYNTADLIPLSQLLAGLSFENIVDILSDTARMIRELAEYNLILDNVKCANEYIFKADDGYEFIYIPISQKSRLNVSDFIIKLISVIHYKDIRLNVFVKEMRKKKDDTQALAYLNAFVASYNDRDSQSSEETSLLSEEGETSLLGIGEYEFEGETSLLSDDDRAAVLGSKKPDDDCDFSDPGCRAGRFTKFIEDKSGEYETTVLTSEPVIPNQPINRGIDSEYCLYLTRNLNGERVMIDVTPFTIGKDRANVDYVLDNNSVSRYHATIFYENGTYFIMDNNSTNGTTIEGIRLQANEKGEIGNGYIISLGNESFQAHIERR